MSRYYDSKGSFRRRRSAEEVDPMSSMGNMGDVMLVFACGLMVALVVAWNVDLAQFQQVETDQELSREDMTSMNDQLGQGDSFIEMGKVYQDPTSGKYYLVEEGAGSSDSGSGSSSSSSSSESD